MRNCCSREAGSRGALVFPGQWRHMNDLAGHGRTRQNQHHSKDGCAQERCSKVEKRGGWRKERSLRTHLAFLLLSFS